MQGTGNKRVEATLRQKYSGNPVEIIPRKMISDDADKVKESVKDYYGKRLKTSDDLQTNACKLGDKSMSSAVKSALKLIHDEVSSK